MAFSAGCGKSDSKEDNTKKLETLLQEENYSEAAQVADFSNQSDINLICASLDEKINKYNNGEITKEEAKKSFDSFSSVHAEQIETKKKEFNDLVNSKTAYDSAVVYEKDKNYSAAIEQYGKVIEKDTNYPDAQTKLETCRTSLRSEIIASAEQSVTDDDYPAAIKTIQDGLEIFPDDVELKSKLDTYSTAYVTKAVGEADTAVADRDYDAADTAIDEALKVLPDNQTLKDKKEEINGSRPVVLKDIHILEKKNYEYSDEGVFDAYGNDYSQTGVFTYDGYCLYYLDKKYKTFTGKLVVTDDSNTDADVYVNIYADDKLVYTKKGIKRLTKAIDFEADVTDCDQLKVVVGHDNHYGKLAICNGSFFK